MRLSTSTSFRENLKRVAEPGYRCVTFVAVEFRIHRKRYISAYVIMLTRETYFDIHHGKYLFIWYVLYFKVLRGGL